MGYEFDEDTAVVSRGGGVYDAQITPRWNVGDKPNGGYLLALALRAAAEESPLPHPLVASAHYMRTSAPGPAVLDVEMIRSGRSHATAQVRVLQQDAEVVRVVATFGDLSRLDGPTTASASPPAMPPLEECVRGRAQPGGGAVAMAERFETAAHPDTLGWARGQCTGTAFVGAWMRLVDGREPDPLSLAMIVDALPPPVFELGAAGWVPTIELTTHVRALPAAGWLRVFATTRFVQGGYLEEDAEVWDSTDTLVAQSRQLARVTGWGH